MMRVYHIAVERAGSVIFSLCGDGDADDETIIEEFWRDGVYTCVAGVGGNNLSHAYTVTQNVDASWSKDPAAGVTVMVPAPVRSTMVGDLIETGGELHMVAMIGFKKMSFMP